MVIAALATFYTLFLIGGRLRQAAVVLHPLCAGGDVYVMARRERNLRLFRPAEAVLFGIIVLGAVAGIVSLATGAIAI